MNFSGRTTKWGAPESLSKKNTFFIKEKMDGKYEPLGSKGGGGGGVTQQTSVVRSLKKNLCVFIEIHKFQTCAGRIKLMPA